MMNKYKIKKEFVLVLIVCVIFLGLVYASVDLPTPPQSPEISLSPDESGMPSTSSSENSSFSISGILSNKYLIRGIIFLLVLLVIGIAIFLILKNRKKKEVAQYYSIGEPVSESYVGGNVNETE